MESTVKEILASYNAAAALPDAHTIPARWYTDPRIAQLELQNVFSRTWQAVGARRRWKSRDSTSRRPSRASQSSRCAAAMEYCARSSMSAGITP